MKDLIGRIKKYILESEEFDPALAIEVANFQLLNNPVYGRFAKKKGISRIRKVEDIPFLPVEFFKHEDVFSCSLHEGYFLSSGTGGNRSKVYYNQESLALYRASALRSFPFKGEQLFSLIPPFRLFPRSSLSFMLSLFPGVQYLNLSYEISPEDVFRSLSGRKGVVFSTSTQLLRLTEWLKERKKTLEGEFIWIETGGYKGLGLKYHRQSLYLAASSVIEGAEFWSEYGMAELFSQFYAPSRGGYKPHPYAMVFTRGRGLFRVFDFANLCTVSALLVPDIVEVEESGAFLVLGRSSEEERGCGYVFR